MATCPDYPCGARNHRFSGTSSPPCGKHMPAVLHREAPALRLRVHVAAVHLQNVVVARKTLVQYARLCRRRLKYILGRHRLCSTRDGDVSQSTLSLGTFA